MGSAPKCQLLYIQKAPGIHHAEFSAGWMPLSAIGTPFSGIGAPFSLIGMPLGGEVMFAVQTSHSAVRAF